MIYIYHLANYVMLQPNLIVSILHKVKSFSKFGYRNTFLSEFTWQPVDVILVFLGIYLHVFFFQLKFAEEQILCDLLIASLCSTIKGKNLILGIKFLPLIVEPIKMGCKMKMAARECVPIHL